MLNILKLFCIIFCVVMIINQAFYNWCFELYCLKAAFPRVLALSVAVVVIMGIQKHFSNITK